VLPERLIDAFHTWSMATSEVNVSSTTQAEVAPRISTAPTNPFCHWVGTEYRAVTAGGGGGNRDGDFVGDTVRPGRGDLALVGVGLGLAGALVAGTAAADGDGDAADEGGAAGISMTLYFTVSGGREPGVTHARISAHAIAPTTVSTMTDRNDGAMMARCLANSRNPLLAQGGYRLWPISNIADRTMSPRDISH